jgi:hypothetical protein
MEDNFDNDFKKSQHERSKKKAALSAATLTPLDNGWVPTGDIEYLTAESLAILKQRGQEWYDKWPQGEPYLNETGEKIKIDIYINQVAELLKTEVHIAKNILMVAAKVLGIDARDAVTVKQFCHLFNCKESAICPVIQNISPELSPMEEFFNTPQARAQAEKSKQRALKSIAKLKPIKRTFKINGVTYLTVDAIEILKQRAMEWFDDNPLGEAMAIRHDGHKYRIHTNQVMDILEVSKRTAQTLLKICRQVLGKPKGAVVSVLEFCKLNMLDEDDFRKALSSVEVDYLIK